MQIHPPCTPLHPCDHPRKNHPASAKPSVSISLNLDAWEELLPLDHLDWEYILLGVNESFQLVNLPLNNDVSVEVDNYESATNVHVRPYVEHQIQQEICYENYAISDSKLQIVSALGGPAKNKEQTKFRHIHDASRSDGQALNDISANIPSDNQLVNNAMELIKPKYFLAKLDLSNAYGSISIHPSNYKATGRPMSVFCCPSPP